MLANCLASRLIRSTEMGPQHRIGLCLRPEYDEYSLEFLADCAASAEEHGYHSVWLAESWGHDSIALLSNLGAHTRSIALGTAVVNPFSRTPALLAMSAVTMADLYPGRFLLGIGAGTKAVLEGWHGIAYDRPVERIRDAVAFLRRALRGEVVSYEGKTLSVSGYRLRIPPRQAPSPIYVAGLGPKSMRMVGEVADGWIPYLLPLSELPQAISIVRQHAVEAGRDGGELTMAPMIVTCVSEDPAEAQDVARRHLSFYFGAMGPHYRAFASKFGLGSLPEEIAKYWAAGQRDRAYELVSDRMVDELTISGDPASCRSKLRRYISAGADLPILFFPKASTSAMVGLAIASLSPRTTAGASVVPEAL